MATLEVHDAGRRVRRIRITRDNPVMFGSDPMCDVVLDGPGVQPFHGRIRWQKRRFKADASPDVPWIDVNGVQVKSKSLYQGDEIRVGQCRIFLMSLEDGPDHGEKTVVREAPASTGPARSRPDRTDRPVADFLAMEMAPPSMESPTEPPLHDKNPEQPLKRRAYRSPASIPSGEDDESLRPASAEAFEMLRRRRGEESAALPTVDPVQEAIADRIKSIVPSFQPAPGDDRVFSSPMVRGLALTFVILVIFSVVLWRGIARVTANRIYTLAVDDMNDGNFLNAIRGFGHFLDSSPDDQRAGKARVLRALARVRQHTGQVGTSWGSALTEARSMVEEVGQVPEYRDSNMELAEDLRKAAEGLADRSANLADPGILSEAESAVSLHARVAGQAAPSMIERSKIPEKLDKARAAIRKSRERASALAAMDAALKANRPGDAYAARYTLTRRYHDLAADKEVIARLIRANDLIRQAVVLDPSGRPGETEPHREPLGPPTSLVLRLDPGRKPTNRNGSVAYALADGLAVGLDAATGAPLWQVSVGVASPFPPMAIAGDSPSVLVVDARHDELIRLDGRTGALVWRQETGGAVVDPPLILGNMVLQPTPDGRLLQIDLASGDLRGTLKLGRKLSRTPVADDSALHLYQVADEDCLFILTLDPLACAAVEYLGHEAGSIPCPPSRIGRFFVLAENHLPESGRLRVFVLDEAGIKLRQAQEIPVGGWTRSTPAAAGPVIWSSSDRGELAVFSIGAYDARAPFAPAARIAPGTEPEGPAFGRARSDRDFTLASSRTGRYDLDLERGKLSTAWTLGEAGPALAAPQAFDRLIVLTQQNASSPGASLWGVDATSGEVRWRTVLGAPWPVPLSESTTGDALIGLTADGRPLSIGRDQLRSGGFLEQALPRPGQFRLPETSMQRLEINGLTVVVPSPDASKVLVRDGPNGEFKTVGLPAPLGAPVVAIGGDLLIPGVDGRVYLIDPRTGTSAADPYIPPFDRARPIRWRRPVLLEGNAVAMGDSEATIRRFSVDRTTRPRLTVTAEARLDSPLATDPASTGASVVIATVDGRVRSLAARDLGAQGSWPLEAPRLLGPLVVADHAFVVDAEGNVVAFGPDGRRLWSSRLLETLPAGPPSLRDSSAWFLGLDGSIQKLSMSDGTPQARVPLRLLPVGGPLAAGPDLVLPTGPGTLRLLDRKAIGEPSEDPKP
jgi:outer membrane protein assembly factor BamB